MEIGEESRERLGYTGERQSGRLRRRGGWVLGAVVVFLLLYYPIGMAIMHNVDDDPDFQVDEASLLPGSSHAAATAAQLIRREIDQNGWRANDPFFMPSAALDNMPNFQQGLISAVARFAFELMDQIGRTRGSSEADPDLRDAAGLLQYSGKVWIWDPTVSLAPTATSEQQYRKAMKALEAYNERLAEGDAVFERRADNLLATLDRIALDIGSSSAVIDRHLAENAGYWIDTQADNHFYFIKGQAYAYLMILRALQTDFANVIAERELGAVWDQMDDSMEKVALMDPLIVVNGPPDGLILPSHLAAQGFYLLRARTQLREITNILLK